MSEFEFQRPGEGGDCRKVQIHDCRFTGCGDDTIGVKSDYALGRTIASADIYVWDSYFESGCNGLQFGSETAKMKNATVLHSPGLAGRHAETIDKSEE